MIQAQDFVEHARRLGYGWYAGVPCSFLTPFINYVIEDRQLTYVSAANEGDALAASAGAWIGGTAAAVMMQNSGLGNAVNPLTSLAYTFRIPLLIIVTLRGDPDLKDEPQHELMGRITGDMLNTMGIPWDYFPEESGDIEPLMGRVQDYIGREQRPCALVMRKGTVAPHALGDGRLEESSPESVEPPRRFESRGRRPSRNEALRRVIEHTSEQTTVVIATTGYTGRELYALADRPNQLYMVGSMGCASSLALGLAMSRPDLRVVVVDGDGAALMRMGNFATLGAYGGPNLVHVLLDNEVHDSTGGQATVSAGVSFARIAAACGYATAMEGEDIQLLDVLLHSANLKGPRFGHLKIRPGSPDGLPRPASTPEEVLQRFRTHIGAVDV